ncbi:L,D-transpeptidase [Oceaniradius stylonematis]|jgi:lipoprotein-anchoring transpeptidase ErfK/SrfK|uniref:L,D-transpeptidase n=1 Tax=Oceaniradius stylonematis TaxID=2184161 RepID=A0A3A8AHL2_9HYPH|nr:L,D-transpeptidase [Oceaniradius stylonematis]RKF07150.1 L,D-transpeptidase [Oceaniradius stylonematis]RNC96501.1 MAG: L,D-transpeptidase [Oricola sp.]
MTRTSLTRRRFAAGAASLAGLGLAGCTTAGPSRRAADIATQPPAPSRPSPTVVAAYGPMPGERFPLPAIDISKVPPQFWRQQVAYPTPEPPGTLVVDTANFFLYLVQEAGQAMRYGVGLGRAGFEWSGRGRVAYKRQWPTWTPPDEMIARQPELERWSVRNGGMPPGLDNPLGARALYIFDDGVDTLYRVHGSPEYWTIGKAVSSGCVRMMQQDVIDLYNRVPTPAPIVVV